MGDPNWSGERGSNPRPQLWESCALPTELPPRVFDFELEFRTSVLKCRPSQVASRMSLDNPFWRPLALDNPSTLWTILPRARRPHSIVPELLRHSGHHRAVVRNSRTDMAEPEDGAAFWRKRFDMIGQSPGRGFSGLVDSEGPCTGRLHRNTSSQHQRRVHVAEVM